MSSWKVTQEAINALYNMSNQLQELAENIHKETQKLRSTFEETQHGLGAHSADIESLIEEVEGTEQDATVPVKKLVLKLQRSALIRTKHLEEQSYTNIKGKTR
jgi:uncharacterized phage infection (PIP) family protein YhgE